RLPARLRLRRSDARPRHRRHPRRAGPDTITPGLPSRRRPGRTQRPVRAGARRPREMMDQAHGLQPLGFQSLTMTTEAAIPTTARDDLAASCAERGRRARAAERLLRVATGKQKNDWLLHSADTLEAATDSILQANALDLAAAAAN